jgi:hypothetical protein
VEVFPALQKVFLGWFTYDTERPAGGAPSNLGEPGHRWLTAFGSYAGDHAELDIELTEGGVFNSSEPAITQSLDGTIDLDFAGCNAATVTYDITSIGRQGSIPIQRLSLDNVERCESFAAQSAAEQGDRE